MNFQKTAANKDLEVPLLSESHKSSDGDEPKTTVIDGRCNLVNGTYFIGFLTGVLIQSVSLYAISVLLPSSDGVSEVAITTTATTTTTTTTTTTLQPTSEANVPLIFVLYLFCRYWVLAAFLLPPLVTTIVLKYRKRKSAHATIKGNLESYFECVRFQLGMFFGSLILLSLVNFYALANTAPLCMLLAYYAACVVVSFFALCLLQIFVNQICANVSSVEIIVSYEKDEEDRE